MSTRKRFNLFARAPQLTSIQVNWIWVIRRTLLNLEIFFTIVVSFISAVFAALISIARILFTGVFWYVIIGFLIWYIVVTLWIWFATVIVLIGIPVYNVIVDLFNVFGKITIEITRILIMVWNMFVPFIGMIITFIVDVVVKILAEIFNEIGSINFEPLINALMQILVPIVQIAMQILLVLIKVGIDVITALADVIGGIVEAILTFVKIILPILTWILKLLYEILEPILAIIGFFFGSVADSDSPNRRLLEMGGSPNTEDTMTFEHFVKDTLGSDALKSTPSASDYMTILYMKSRGQSHALHGLGSQRELLSQEREADSFFVQNDPLRFKESKDIHNDDRANVVGDLFYRSARGMSKKDLTLAEVTMNDIVKTTRGKAGLHLETILAAHRTDMPEERKTLAHLRFPGTPVHPAVMHEKWLKESGPFDELVAGRKLMFQGADKMFNKTEHKIQHAKNVVRQQEAYLAHHFEIMKQSTIIHNAAQTALRHSFQHTLNPESIVAGGQAMMEYAGFESIWDAFDHFKKTYRDSQGVLRAVAESVDLPFLSIFQAKERRPSPLFTGSWNDHGRKLMQSDQQDVRRGETGGAYGGLPIVSTLGCNAKPPNENNPLCIPEIPRNFSVNLKKINLTPEQRKQLLHDPKLCPPWKYTLCFPYCTDRLWNAWQTVRFILSAIPPINYAVAGYTKMFPLFSWVFDWMFMVPKFKTARLIQWTCFAFHLFDLALTIALAALLWIFLRPVYLIFSTTWSRIQSARGRTVKPFFLDTWAQRSIENMVLHERLNRGIIYTHRDGQVEATQEQTTAISRDIAHQEELRFNHSTVEMDRF